MQALKVYRLSDGPRAERRYIDGRRVSLDEWNRAHYGRDTDTYALRMDTRKNGAVIVRAYHCIRAARG